MVRTKNSARKAPGGVRQPVGFKVPVSKRKSSNPQRLAGQGLNWDVATVRQRRIRRMKPGAGALK